MLRPVLFASCLFLASCGNAYSPDVYASSAAQQAAKVEQATVVGVRKVAVSASGVTGGATGAAAGAAVGASAPGSGVRQALTGIAGGLVGGLVGAGVEHAAGDTDAFEYICRKPNGEMVSVTQKDAQPLALGAHVLVIAGSQARIVPDYTTPAPEPKPAEVKPAEPKPPEPKPADSSPTPLNAPSPAQAAPAVIGPI